MPRKAKSTYSLDAYESIKDLIITNNISPGENITEQALASKLDIGRTPIREALKRLEQEGLIVSENRRKRIPTLTVEEVNQIFEIKYALESYLCYLAAQRATNKELEKIESIMKKMQDHSASNQPDPVKDEDALDQWFDRWMKLDAKLHETIYKTTDNIKSIEIIQGLNLKIHRFKLGMLALKGRVAISLAEHQSFVDGVLARDGERAQRAMQQHLTNVQTEMVKLMNIFAAST